MMLDTKQTKSIEVCRLHVPLPELHSQHLQPLMACVCVFMCLCGCVSVCTDGCVFVGVNDAGW